MKRMREIKFRGKRVDNREWINGYLLKDDITGQVFILPFGNSVNESDKVGEEGCLRFFAFEVEENTICQYTGLKDKNGVEIYEGDILKYEWDGKTKIDYIVFSGGMFTYSKCVRWSLHKDEVIGNIYENPDLLEVTHED